MTAVPSETQFGTLDLSNVRVLGIAGLQDVFNVMAYGAKGDGVTDDTAAIQAAVNAGSNAGGIVFFPPGTYLVSAYVNVNAGGVIFAGCGSKSVLQLKGAALPTWGVFKATAQAGLQFQDLEFWGNGAAAVTFNDAPILSLAQCTNVKIRRCRFFNVTQESIATDLASDWIIDACTFDTSGANQAVAVFMPAIDLGVNNDTSNRISITKCKFVNLHWSAIWLQANDSSVIGCSFTSVGEANINNNGQRNRIVGNYCEGNFVVSEDSYFLESFADDAVVADNISLNAGQTAPKFGSSGGAGGIFIGGGGNIVSGNRVLGAFNVGIAVQANANQSVYHGTNSGKNITVTGNVTTGCGQAATALNGGIVTSIVGAKSFSALAIADNVLTSNLGSGTLYTPNAGDTGVRVAHNAGVNPLGKTAYQLGAMPASGTPWTNTDGVSGDMYLSGGTVTNVQRKDTAGNLVQIATATPCVVHLEPDESVIITYSVQPSSIWFGY